MNEVCVVDVHHGRRRGHHGVVRRRRGLSLVHLWLFELRRIFSFDDLRFNDVIILGTVISRTVTLKPINVITDTRYQPIKISHI